MSNLPDTIYEEWCDETEALKIKADMPAVAVVGELTRALKRIIREHGGTAFIENGVHYDINNEEIEDV